MLELLHKIRNHRYEIRKSQNLSAAKMFLEKIFSNLEFRKSKKYSNYKFYLYNGEIIANITISGSFYYHDLKIYQVLAKEFKLNDPEIEKLIKLYVKKHLKIRINYTYPNDGSGWVKIFNT